jgi:hypothetical protein
MSVDFKATQADFAGYIRDPYNHPVPANVKPQRMAIYRELFFNNINSFLSSNFPVLRKIMDDEQWQNLATDFFARHRCQTPHFSEIAEEFLDYLQNQRPIDSELPFMLELAHYEWVEMALSIAQAEPVLGDELFIEQVLQQKLSLSPLAWPLVYQYPVQQIGPSFLPQTAPDQPSYLIVYRDTDDQVHFMQTTPITYRLLQLIDENHNISGQRSLHALATEMSQQIDTQMLMQFGLQTLQELAVKGIIIPAAAV